MKLGRKNKWITDRGISVTRAQKHVGQTGAHAIIYYVIPALTLKEAELIYSDKSRLKVALVGSEARQDELPKCK